MDFISSAVNRVARAIGLSSEPANEIVQPNNGSRSTPSTSVERPASRSRDIIHIAFLLHHRLPADLVPMILEHAELWETTRLVYRHHPERITSGQSPRVFAGAVIPSHLPRGSIRLVRFKTISRDQGWSDHRNDHNTYNNSWTWFEASITDSSDDLEPRSCRHDSHESEHLEDSSHVPGRYKYDSKKIVTNLHAHREYMEHTVEWRFDHEDDQIRRMVKDLKGGCGIEVIACAMFPGWCNNVKSVLIEIECPLNVRW